MATATKKPTPKKKTTTVKKTTSPRAKKKTEEEQIQDLNLFDGCVCAVLQFSRPGNRKKVDSEAVQADAEPESYAVTKKLLDSEKFQKIRRVDVAFHRWLKRVGVPAPQFREGVTLIPIDRIEEVETRYQDFRANREDLINDFMKSYDQLVVEAEEKLKSLYNADDYPPADIIRSKFAVALTYQALGQAPNQLQTISAKLFEDAQNRVNSQWEETAQGIFAVLRQEFLETVQNLSKRVSSLDDKNPEEKMILGEQTINKLRDFCESFKSRNITNDAELRKLTDQVQKLLGNGDGITAKEIKSTEDLRKKIRGELDTIVANADALVTEAPKRKFRIR